MRISIVFIFLGACASAPTPTHASNPGTDSVGSPTAQVGSAVREIKVVRVFLRIQPNEREAFLAYMSEEVPVVRALEGCMRYELLSDPADSNRFLLYEEWSSPASFETFQSSPVLAESFRVLGPMMAGPPDSAYFDAREVDGG